MSTQGNGFHNKSLKELRAEVRKLLRSSSEASVSLVATHYQQSPEGHWLINDIVQSNVPNNGRYPYGGVLDTFLQQYADSPVSIDNHFA